MLGAIEFVAFVAVAFVYSIAAWGVLKSRRTTPYLHSAVALVVFFAPLMIGSNHVMLRALACVIAIELMLKMIDYSRRQRHGAVESGSFASYASFLIPFPVLLVGFGKRQRQPRVTATRHKAILTTAFACAVFLAGFALVDATSRIDAVRSSFVLDHALILVIFTLTIEALSRMLHGFERLAGFETTPLIQNAFLSQTVSEFWCRYNTRVHSWLYENIFLPCGGRRAPVRGILLTYFVSAILHEFSFALATSRLDGYQFTFFMLQAPAVLASRPLRRFAISNGIGGSILAHVLTVLWLGVTSIFFFHGVNRVFPFVYAAKPCLP